MLLYMELCCKICINKTKGGENMKKNNFKSIVTRICLLFAVCLLVSFNPVKAEAATATGQDIVTEAKKYLGVPYQWGGNGPSTFDCSGFTKYVYGQFGINLPRVASDQASSGTSVAQGNLQPGDLVFWGSPAYHVGIYIGNNQYIHAPQDNDVVKISTLSTYTSARRIIKNTGWVLSNGTYYYYNADGSLKTGWLLENNQWYWLNNDASKGSLGAAATQWRYIDGYWYWFNDDASKGSLCKMMTGWLNVNGDWYYLNDDTAKYGGPYGGMLIGDYTIGNKLYHFNEYGRCTNPY